LLAALGLAPRMTHCLACGRELKPTDRRARFAYARGGILCPDCAHTDARETLPIAPDVLATIAAWQRSPAPRAARATRSTPAQLDAVHNLLGLFMSYHLDVPLRSRAIALDLLRRKLTA
ncbi:MAG TPA: DNA repair protein RecO C-terminal domain-containing protein, partial [Kiritimatiellia bacterium]